MTNVQRAARFLCLQRTCFGGKVGSRPFAADLKQGSGSRFNVSKVVPMIEELHERLADVVIECLPYADFIARYDRPGALFYLDPPCWGAKTITAKTFSSGPILSGWPFF